MPFKLKLRYYGRADLMRWILAEDAYEDTDVSLSTTKPIIVAFPSPELDGDNYIAVYEVVEEE